ncbi:MAG: Asp-tRNA(Asn)/Glu-tRNA(Gln) amidotransferase subunit GatB, partial [Pseudomonadales bacterium]
ALVRYLGICDGNLAEGSMRCDANVSVRKIGDPELGIRTEIKNINSFRFVEQAVAYEIERQIEVLEDGGSIVRETRLYDSERNETRSMRTKEDSDDYRYFADPDLMPLVISEAEIEALREQLPELPQARRARYVETLGLTDADALQLVADPELAGYFEAGAAVSGDGKLTANWVLGEFTAALNRDDCTVPAAPISPEQLGSLIMRIKDGTISGKIAKTVFEALWTDTPASDEDPASTVDGIIEARGLQQMSDSGELEAIIAGIIADNPNQVAQFLGGKDKVFGFFVGQVMKATQGKANPETVNTLLRAQFAALQD